MIDNDKVENGNEIFDFSDEDYCAIDLAIRIARILLKDDRIKPIQVIGLGNALYALERMPISTPGVNTEFGIIYNNGNDNSSEMRYIDFRITETHFEISRGGSNYDLSVGSDSFSEPGWLIEIDGYREYGCALYEIEDDITEYFGLGAELSVSDESDIDYEYDDEEGNHKEQLESTLTNLVISREEVETQDIEPALSFLKRFLVSPDIAKGCMEKINISFDGYNQHRSELFEIDQVRDYVYELDRKFPFWLYFLTKLTSGLQSIMLCFLPPFLTEEARAEIHPQRLGNLLVKRWIPAMNQVSEYAGLTEKEIEELTDRMELYITDGPRWNR